MLYSAAAQRIEAWLRCMLVLEAPLTGNHSDLSRGSLPAAYRAQKQVSALHRVSSEARIVMQRMRRGFSSLLASSDKESSQNATSEHWGVLRLTKGILPKPLSFPAVLEQQYRDARARSSWKRDVTGYAIFIFLMSSVYVITTCYLHGQAEAAAANMNSQSTATASTPISISTFWDAPTAAEYHRLLLHPKYSITATAAAADGRQQSCGVAGSEPTLQQLLHQKAAAVVENLASSSGSKVWGVASVLLRPQQLALLYLWRVWVQNDLALLVKLSAGVVALVLAVLNPGSYCTHRVRTPLVAAYLVAPLLLLQLQLLAADTSCASGIAAASAAQGYQVLLSYAPLVVLVSSVLHPLPFRWQAAVNLISWGALAAASLVLRLKYAPVAAVAAAHGSITATAAAAAGALGSAARVSSTQNFGMLFFELLVGSLDGLLLSVVLPLLLGAWLSRRARKSFLQTGNTSSISNSAMVEHYQQPQQPDTEPAVQQQDELPDAAQTRIATPAATTATKSTDQMVSCVSSVASNTSLLKKAATNAAAANAAAAAAKSDDPSDSAMAAASAGQFCIVRGISIPSANAAGTATTGSSNPTSSSPPSSCASSTLDQPRTPIMMPESRGGSSGSTKSVRLNLPILAEPSIAAASTGFTGSRSNASSSGSSGSGLNGGAGGTAARARQQQQGSGLPAAAARVQHGLGTLSPERPSALYSSPLETVIVSFKLASRTTTGGAAAAMPGAGAAMSRSRSPSPAAVVVPAAVQAAIGLPPASPSAAGATAAGHGGASTQLKAEIEAAVRQVVAQSEYHVLCTSVSTFPGCVHVVVNLQLCRASDIAAQLAAAAAGVSAAWVDQAGSSSSSLADVDWGRAVDWGQVVHQLQQYKFIEDRGVAHLAVPAAVAAAGPSRSAEGSTVTELHLQYMLVQDGAGRDQWYWQAAPIQAVARQVPAAAAAVAPVASSSTDLTMQTASSSRSRGSTDVATAPPTPLLLNSAAAPGSSAPSPQAAVPAAAAAGGDDVRFSAQEIIALQTLASGSFRGAESADYSLRDESAHAVMRHESPRAIMVAESAPPAVNWRQAVNDDSSDGGSGRNSMDSVTSTATSSSMTPGRAQGLSAHWQQQHYHQQQQQQGSVRSPVQSFGSILPHRAHIPMPDHMVLPSTTPSSGAAAAMHLAAAVHGHAQGITMSGLTLPSDQGWLEMLSGPNLKVPENLAASLTAASAGLRVVITSSAKSAAAAVGPQFGSYEAGSSTASSSTGSMYGDSVAEGFKPLVDVIFWPAGNSSSGSSSSGVTARAWPTGGLIAVHQLLPAGTQGSWLVNTHGPVLAINLLVTPAKPAAAAGTRASRSSSMTECLLLQLPLLLVPSVICQGLQWMSAKMTREARSYEVAFHQHMLPLVRDIASLLLGPQSDQFLALTAPVATAVAAGIASSSSSSSPHRNLLLQQHQAVYGWLAANVLGFLRSQGAVECAMILRHMIKQYLPAPTSAPTPAPVAVPTAAAAAGDADMSAANTPRSTATTEIDPVEMLDMEPVAQEAPVIASALAALAPIAVAPPAAVDSPATVSPAVSAVKGAAVVTALSDMSDFTEDLKPLKEPFYETLVATPKSDQFSAAEALKAAAAAAEDAQAARNTVAETTAALQAALQSLSRLSASAAAAEQQARRAESAAALAARRAAAAEALTQRQRALYLIGGGHVEGGVLGQSVWGLLGAASRLRNGTAAEVLSAPPVLPAGVSQRDVLFGFSDERLEVQYRRLKALQIRFVDQVALAVQVLKEATIVWKIARALHTVSDTRLSLILLCKYEAVTLLPYLVALLCPDFWVQHRNFTLMLSQVACALTVGMITATEIYRHEWSQLLHHGNATMVHNLTMVGFEPAIAGALTGSQDLTLISRPGMLIAWFYLVVPLLQQLCVPDQLVSCVAQAVQSYLAYRFIFQGQMGFGWLMGWLGLGGLVSLGVAYVADSFMRRQAVASARRSLLQGGGGNTGA